MIKRAPRPSQDFLILRNDVARDSRLSYMARGLLIAILSRPDNWTTSAERLKVEAGGGEGIKSIRKALRELETAGYLVRRRLRDPSTGRFSWEQSVYDTPLRGSNGSDCPISTESSISPCASDGAASDGKRPSKEQPRRTTDKEERTAQHSPAACGGGSARDVSTCDRSGVDDGEPDDESGEVSDEWRVADRELFTEHVGEELLSHGTVFSPGQFPGIQFYGFFREGVGKRKAVRWPGQYLTHLARVVPEGGVDDWLASFGLERVV